jgi:hypothetical protein
MTTRFFVPGGCRLMALLVLALVLAGTGVAAQTPEPLRNREDTPPAVPAPEATGGSAVVVPPAGATATGTGGNQDATVIVTPTGPAVGVVVPGGPAPASGPDAVVPGQGGVLVPVVPGEGKGLDGTGTPAGKTPEGKVPDGGVTATGTGGNQNTKVLVAPQTPVGPAVTGPGTAVPGKAVPGQDGLVPGQDGTTAPLAGPPVAVAPDGKVLDAAGQTVALAPGQPVVLPQGGKVIDGQGRVVTVPPGGSVIMGARAMTPGDFLPKTGGKPGEAKPAPAVAPPAAKPEAQPQPGQPVPGKAKPKAEKPAGKPPTVVAEAPPKPGDRFKITDEACHKHTLGFLDGCWRGGIVLSDKTRVTMRLCFGATGVGKRIELYDKTGVQCTGATRAQWQGDNLSFSFGTIYCTNGREARDVPIVCNGCGESTRCIGSEYSDRKGMIGKTNFEIVRE